MQKTQTISVREFRQNLSLFLRAAQLKNVHFVVMRHLEPVAEIIPPRQKKKTQKQLKAELLRDLQEAEAQWERGEYYTREEVGHMLGLRSGSTTRKKHGKNSIVFPKPPPRAFSKK